MKNKTIRLFILFITLYITVFLIVGAKSCGKSSGNKTKSGSSILNAFTINAPSGLTATLISYTQINLSWQDNSNNETGFQLERTINRINWELINTLTSNTTSYSDTSVVGGNTYYYRIRAFMDTGDYSNYSNEVYAITYDYNWIPVSWTAIAGGYFESLAVATNGTLWSWGYNTYGQLGLGDTTDRLFPFLVESDFYGNIFDGTSSAGAGEGSGNNCYAFALKTTGTIWGWGANPGGQLGTGDTENSWIPYPLLDTSTDWFLISVGDFHSLAIKNNPSGGTSGTLWGWGYNVYGQLGLGDAVNRLSPSQVGNNSDWIFAYASYNHTLGIKTNRTLWAWGLNSDAQLGLGNTIEKYSPTQVNSWTDWLITSGGYSFSLGIRTNGTLWSWGNNDYGQLGLGNISYWNYSNPENPVYIDNNRKTPTQVTMETDWSTIDSGPIYSIGLKNNGSMWSWGNNYKGELGLGDTWITRLTPTQIGNQTDWSLIATASEHVIAIKNDGSIWTWGRNTAGQLGLGDTINRTAPSKLGTPIPPDSLFVTATSSSSVNLSWSDNSINEIMFEIERSSNDNNNFSSLAAVSANITSYTDNSVFAGTKYYYRISAYNSFGNSIYSNQSSVIPILAAPTLLTINVISSTQNNLSWNDNSLDETGFSIERRINYNGTYVEIGTTGPGITNYSDITPDGFAPYKPYYYRVRANKGIGFSDYSNEVFIGIIQKWIKLIGSNSSSMAIKTNGTLWSWGANSWGQLGLGDSGTTTYRTTPTQVNSASDWINISGGTAQSSAMKTGGTIWSCGRNSNGQLGFGNLISPDEPTQVGTQSDWMDFAIGSTQTLAIKTNLVLWSWGQNTYGQLGVGDATLRTTPSQAGTDSNWLKVEAGYEHSLGIKTNYTLWSWGRNNYGQLGLGDSITNRNTPTFAGTESDWVIISAGGDSAGAHSLAIKLNGTIWAWGSNSYGQLGLGDTINKINITQIGNASDWSEISAGSYHTVAYKTTQTIWVWGANSLGQLGLGDTTNRDTPTQLNTESDWVKSASGWYHSFGVKTSGILWSWGQNNYGQLGLGDTFNRNTPTSVGE